MGDYRTVQRLKMAKKKKNKRFMVYQNLEKKLSFLKCLDKKGV